MDKERLKYLLRKGKEEFGQYWEENWKKIHEIYVGLANRIINGEDPRSWSNEDYGNVELRNKCRDIDRLFWWIFGGVSGSGEMEDEDVEKFRDFLREISKANSEHEATEILRRYENKIRGLGVISLTTWASIIHPKWFAPLWGSPRDKRGVINPRNAPILGVSSSIQFFDQYIEVLTKIKEVTKETVIDNMIEVAFYLSKYQPENDDPKKERIRLILERVEISENEFEEIKNIIHDVREKILNHIDELKDKGWENGWDILNQLNRVPYIDFRNIPQAFRHEELPKILADYINRLKDTESLEDIHRSMEDVASQLRNIPYIKITQLLHLSHVIRPELFIPVTQWQISKSVCYIYNNTIAGITNTKDKACPGKLHGTSMEKTSNILDLMTELRNLAEEIDLLNELPKDERMIKFSLALYKYGKDYLGDIKGPETEEKRDRLEEELKNKIETILKTKRQVILYGPPGTGKTWAAHAYIEDILGDDKERMSVFVTFHPSYSYEEFVEGLKPIPIDSGLKFIVEDGIFKRIAIRAICEALKSAEDNEDLANVANEVLESLNKIENGEINEYNEYTEKKRKLWNRIRELSKERLENLFKNAPKFYLIIDEINRGDISRIFGELITLLEADKRLREKNQIIVTLPYSKEPFGVPPNLYIIGTMNTADRSIALIDIALRRRFGFIELMPSYKILLKKLLEEEVESEKKAVDRIKGWRTDELSEENPDDIKKLAIKTLYALNERIKKLYDRDHQIGHSYLLKLKECKTKDETIKTLEDIWYHEIIPLLQEYFYDSPKKLSDVLNGKFVEVKDDYYEFKEEGNFIKALKEVAKEGGG